MDIAARAPVTVIVQNIRSLTSRSVELRLRPKEPFVFRAGQYVELAFPQTTTESPTFWPMALANAPHEEALTFCIRMREGSALEPHLKALQSGDPMLVRGPHGDFGFQSSQARHIGLIVTGTGIAPIRSILRSRPYLEQGPPSTTMLFGAETPDDIPYLDELHAMTNLRLHPVLSHADTQWQGKRGWVTDVLTQDSALFSWSDTDFYLCGQPEMQQSASTLLLQLGVSPDAIFCA